VDEEKEQRQTYNRQLYSQNQLQHSQ